MSEAIVIHCHPMAAGELANMGGLYTWIYPDADRRSEGTPKDALVPLQFGVRASRLAPSDVTNDPRPLPPTTERYVRRVSRRRRRADALANEMAQCARIDAVARAFLISTEGGLFAA